MKRVHRLVAVAAMVLVAASAVGRAEATPVVSIDPVSQTANVGDAVLADILVSGLTDPVGAFALQIRFNDTILQGVSFINDPTAKMGPSPTDLSFGFNGGAGSPLDLFFSADLALSAADLTALQGTGFKLATVSFTAAANGVTALALNNVVLSDFLGATIPSSAVNGLACIGGPCPAAPEPGVLSLLGAGAAAMLARRRRSRSNA